MKMEIFLKDYGKMGKRMDSESFTGRMGEEYMENGLMMNYYIFEIISSLRCNYLNKKYYEIKIITYILIMEEEELLKLSRPTSVAELKCSEHPTMNITKGCLDFECT